MHYCKIDCKGARFVNGKASVVLIKEGPTPVETYYRFALIDEKGNLLFDAVAVDDEITYITISKSYIYVGYKSRFETYTIDGKLLAEADLYADNFSTSYRISDDVIIFVKARMDGENIIRNYYCYTPELVPLFS